jgi:hypothetical protein
MDLDVMEAARRPLRELLQKEGLLSPGAAAGMVVVCDDGATEALRWIGGLQFLREAGAEVGAVYDLHSFDARLQAGGGGSREPLPAVDKQSVPTGLFLLTRFVWDMEDCIMAASRRLGLRRVVVASGLSEDAHSCHPHAAHLASETMGQPSFYSIADQLQTSLSRMLSIDAQSRSSRVGASSAGRSGPGGVPVQVAVAHCSLSLLPVLPLLGSFTLSSTAAASSFPMLPWRAREADCAHQPSPAGQLLPDDIPPPVRLQYRLLAHCLADALVHQMRLDVVGRMFALGRTSNLVGTTLAALAEMSAQRIRHVAPLAEASIILLDRTVDLATPTVHGGGECPLLQRILDCLPRTGVRVVDDIAQSGPVSAPNLLDVGVQLPLLFPGLGLPSGNLDSEKNGALKAVSTYKCQLPPSWCHPGSSAADRVVSALASATEDKGHAVLCTALEGVARTEGCRLPPPKKRGMGAAIFALLTSLSQDSDLPCLRHCSLVQLALAAVEALQRTAPQSDPTWELVRASERAQLQAAREGASAADLVEQLMDVSRQAAAPHAREILLLSLRAAALSPEPWSPQVNESLAHALGIHDMEFAREALLRVREAASLAPASLQSPELQFLGLCTFDASPVPAAAPATALPPAAVRECETEGDDWDDWESVGGTPEGGADNFSGAAPSSFPCDTLIGRFTSLVLRDAGRSKDLPELRQVKAVNVASVGLGLLSAGLNKITGGHAPAKPRARPRESSTVVIFVIGGFTPEELREVTATMEAHRAADPTAHHPSVILAGTTISTPIHIYEQIVQGPSSVTPQ